MYIYADSEALQTKKWRAFSASGNETLATLESDLVTKRYSKTPVLLPTVIWHSSSHIHSRRKSCRVFLSRPMFFVTSIGLKLQVSMSSVVTPAGGFFVNVFADGGRDCDSPSIVCYVPKHCTVLLYPMVRQLMYSTRSVLWSFHTQIHIMCIVNLLVCDRNSRREDRLVWTAIPFWILQVLSLA